MDFAKRVEGEQRKDIESDSGISVLLHSESTLQSFVTFSQKPQTENHKLSDFCAFLCDHKMADVKFPIIDLE